MKAHARQGLVAAGVAFIDVIELDHFKPQGKG
jgi:hypothetical protein